MEYLFDCQLNKFENHNLIYCIIVLGAIINIDFFYFVHNLYEIIKKNV